MSYHSVNNSHQTVHCIHSTCLAYNWKHISSALMVICRTALLAEKHSTNAQKRRPWKDRGEIGMVLPQSSKSHQQPVEAREDFSLETCRLQSGPEHLDFGLLASRTVKE